MHPSEEHELTLASATRRITGHDGRAHGQTPRIRPGSLEERDHVLAIDARRDTERRLEPLETRRRRLRRYWATRARHEA